MHFALARGVAQFLWQRPLIVSEHFVNDRFVSRSNAVSKNSTVRDHYSNFLAHRDHFLARNARYSKAFFFR